MTMTQREVAHRVFAREYNDSNLYVEGSGERDPNYIITPLGRKLNRVYLTGVMTERDNLKSPDEPLWRVRVTDPTGTHFSSAGQYQKSAMTKFGQIEMPTFVAIVGKINAFEAEEGDILTSVRAESVKEVGENERDHWIIEAAASTIKQLEKVKEALKLNEFTVEALGEIGFSEEEAKSFIKAQEHYGSIPIKQYEEMIEDSLKFVSPAYETNETPTQSTEQESVESQDEDDELKEVKTKVVETVKDLTNDGKKNVEFNKVMDQVLEDDDITKEEFKNAVEELREAGQLYEPTLGFLQTI